jgi:hypothetical protein
MLSRNEGLVAYRSLAQPTFALPAGFRSTLLTPCLPGVLTSQRIAGALAIDH